MSELYQFAQKHINDKRELQPLKLGVSGNNKKMWDEFNLRFAAVNADFYANLRAKFPKLTPTERKYCALIKLKFSSKDMAQILGVSVETVHITRHRLRKKNKPKGGLFFKIDGAIFSVFSFFLWSKEYSTVVPDNLPCATPSPTNFAAPTPAPPPT